MNTSRDIIIRGNVTIRQPEKISISDNTSINEYCHTWGGGGVSIRHDTAHTVITSQACSSAVDKFRDTLVEAPVVIGINVWIGLGVIILLDITIRNG